jgi:hypothetical protein
MSISVSTARTKQPDSPCTPLRVRTAPGARPSIYDPTLNPVYADLLRHYCVAWRIRIARERQSPVSAPAPAVNNASYLAECPR